MALALPNSIFFHIGRTAGHYVRDAIENLAIENYEIGQYHDWPGCTPLDKAEEQKYKFCFVRHPLDWLASYWCLQMQTGWVEDELSIKIKSDDFSEFLKKVILAFPNGLVTNIYNPYVSRCDFVGKQETIDNDLRTILHKSGEKFNANKILRKVVAVGVNDGFRAYATADKDLLQNVLNSESCRFTYDYNYIPDRLIGDKVGPCLIPFLEFTSDKQNILNPNALEFLETEIAINSIPIDYGIRKHRQIGLMIKSCLDQLDLDGKQVIDVNCTDGAYSLYAKSRGAEHVTAVSNGDTDVLDELSSVLSLDIEHIKATYYNYYYKCQRKYDIALCLKFLQRTFCPQLVLQQISKVLEVGGKLILQCDFLDDFDNVPMSLHTFGSESPTNSINTNFFNIPGIKNTLKNLGFVDINVVETAKMPVRQERDFWKLGHVANSKSHTLESKMGWVALIATYDPPKAALDPLLKKDVVSIEYLNDIWDVNVPQDPDSSSVEKIINNSRREVAKLTQDINILRNKLLELQNGLYERDRHIAGLYESLNIHVDELLSVRATLVDRTHQLETIIKQKGDAKNA